MNLYTVQVWLNMHSPSRFISQPGAADGKLNWVQYREAPPPLERPLDNVNLNIEVFIST